MAMQLTTRHGCAHQFFSDSSCADCFISETHSPTHRPRLILGRHGQAMILDPRTVRELIPHLVTFASTGRMLVPEETDFQI